MLGQLPTSTLGGTGLEVTRLGFGSGRLRGAQWGGGDLSEAAVGQVLSAVLDSGINFVDTAPDYGVSEERIGRHISHRRQEYILASKCGCLVATAPPADGHRESVKWDHDYRRANVIAGVEQSLRRLGTDYIDIVQIHGSPSLAQLEEGGTVEALLDLKRDGKIRFIGMSGTLPELRDHIEMGVFDVLQMPYSIVQRDHETVMAQAAALGAGVVIRGGAAKGAPDDEKPWDAGRSNLRRVERSDPFKNGNAERWWIAAALDELLEGMSRIQFTLRFTLSHPALQTAIVGTSRADHLQANIETLLAGPLPADVYQEAKRRLDLAGARPA